MALFVKFDSRTRRSCHFAPVAGVCVYIVFQSAPKNAESRGCDNESCGPPAGAVERGGSF